MAKPGISQEPIGRLVEGVVSGKYGIPEFQREFVWTKNQVANLLDSLIRGYPIGSILIWDLSDYTQGKHVYENKPKEWIVDGQQRLVALCILNLKKPYWLEIDKWQRYLEKYKIKVNILTLEVSLEYSAIRKNPEWVYPYEIFNANDLRTFAERLATEMNRPDLFTIIYDNAKKIRDILDIDVPIIKVNHSLENIATIFERINSAGTRIKQADITLGYIAAYNKGWVRDKFMAYAEDLDEEGFYFEPTLLIRAITAVGESKAVLREVSEGFLRNENNSLEQAFERFKHCLNRLIREFRNVGILTSKLIYAKNTIIPMIYLYNTFEDEFEFGKAFFFFFAALWRGRYSGASETTLQEDINKIKNAASFEDAIKNLVYSLGINKVDKETVKNATHYQGEGRFLKLMLYLIAYQNGAVDWFTKDRLGYTRHNEINKEFNIEEHHFFPRSLLKGVGFERDEWNLLANIAFINPGTNKRLRDQPYTYIKKYGIETTELEKQLIPLDEDLWKLENYRKFIDVRSQLIADGINQFLESLYPSLFNELRR